MNAATHPHQPNASGAGAAPWHGRGTPWQRSLLALAALAAAGLLLALVLTCQESMRNGERWRAEQFGQSRAALDSATTRPGSVPVAVYQAPSNRRSPG
jgi:hypothetical protein